MQSILQTERECYFTHRTGDLHKHHIYFGPNRKVSDDNGFWVWLIPPLHNRSVQAVHHCRDLDLKLKTECQAKYEETHTREEFMALVGRSYL